VRNVLALTILLGSWFDTRALQGQTIEHLPVTGSLVYHALLHNGTDSAESRGLGLRFAGRVALRVGRGSYVGFTGGSWVSLTLGEFSPLEPQTEYLGSQSEAFVYLIYLQQYISRRVFVRGGAGLAETRTLIPLSPVLIAVTERWRASISLGGGVDLPLVPHVYLTPSVDFTLLPGAHTDARELGSALALGLAITLR
jgi:hypothetical protein